VATIKEDEKRIFEIDLSVSRTRYCVNFIELEENTHTDLAVQKWQTKYESQIIWLLDEKYL
jgi:hypothetical protein